MINHKFISCRKLNCFFARITNKTFEFKFKFVFSIFLDNPFLSIVYKSDLKFIRISCTLSTILYIYLYLDFAFIPSRYSLIHSHSLQGRLLCVCDKFIQIEHKHTKRQRFIPCICVK